jgi:DNA-directed RNA polymerase specialized sigma24 family protein
MRSAAGIPSRQREAHAAPEGSLVNSEEDYGVRVTAPACVGALANGLAGAFRPAGAPLIGTARRAHRTEVLAALRALPAEHSSVIVETFYRGHNVPEAADLLGVSADLVKTRCYDALHALKHALAERGLTA